MVQFARLQMVQQHRARLRGIRRIGGPPQLVERVVTHRVRHLAVCAHKNGVLRAACNGRNALRERNLRKTVSDARGKD